MSEFKTLTELKTEAFGILTGLDRTQDPAVEDLDTIGEYVDPLLAQLAVDEIVLIADSNEIPNEYFLPIARLLANIAGPRFGNPMDPGAKQIDENTLRRFTAAGPTFETLKAVYF